MKLIIGLGNPEPDYDNTRHNIGFMALNNYLDGVSFKKKFDGLFYEAIIKNEKVLFLKPSTYMNNSGISISKCVNFYNIDIDNILVIYDDLDMSFGKLRIKKSSSAGGHNGIKSIISHLNTKDFTKLKIGILNSYKKDTKSFVLSRFSKSELNDIAKLSELLNHIIDDFIEDSDHIKLMNKYN